MTPQEYIDWFLARWKNRESNVLQPSVLIRILKDNFATAEGRARIAESMTQPARMWRERPSNWGDIDGNLENLENFFSTIPKEELDGSSFRRLREAADRLKAFRESLKDYAHLVVRTRDGDRVELATDQQLYLPWDP